MSGNLKKPWHNAAMILLILISLAMLGTISYIIALQSVTNLAISNITGVLITVTGILLGLSGLTPVTKSLERIKLQITLTITTLLWLAVVIMIAQTSVPSTLTSASALLRSLFLVGVALFTILVVMYSVTTIEVTRQRILVEQARRESQPGKPSG
jgi:Ca2+/Na+ antiporter